MPTAKDPSRIFKTQVPTIKSVKLGPSATWSKIKYETQSNDTKLDKSKSTYVNLTQNNHGSKIKRVIKFGPHGEIFISYGTSIEVWDWVPSSIQLKELETKGSLTSGEDEFEGMYLVASFGEVDANEQIIDLEPLVVDQDTNTYKLLLVLKNSKEIHFSVRNFGQLFEEDISNSILILPPSVYGSAPYTVKASNKYVGIATNEGSLTIINHATANPSLLSLDVETVNGKCLFDIEGRFLSYVPASSSLDDSVASTPLNIPSHNSSIYSKCFQTLSITAIDSLAKLSELNAKKTSSNLNLKEVATSFFNTHKQNQRVVVLDLESQRELCNFHPPNGVSDLSLSPYNSHLITVTQRGDQIYKWDLTRIPIEVSLVDTQVRGKTGSIVEQIHWFSNDTFQIITKRSGSVHCFHSDSTTKNWVLPNTQISRVAKINNSSSIIALKRDLESLFVIDSNGSSETIYELPKTHIAKSLLPDFIPLEPVHEKIVRCQQKQEVFPLSEIEIETCSPDLPLIARNKIEFGTYDLNALGVRGFWSNIERFESELKYYKVDFGKGDGTPVFHGDEEDLASAMETVLIG